MGNTENPFIAIAPRPSLARRVAPHRILSMGQIELFSISIECKQMIYAKLNFLKKNCMLI